MDTSLSPFLWNQALLDLNEEVKAPAGGAFFE
jgi:hypothetical protein